jgi:DNA-binding IclR family transcriptional regulator
MVARTLNFLELFAAQKRPLSSADIARMLDIPASSCHDVLQVLKSRGYLYKSTPQVGWYPTLRLFEVAKTIAANDPVMPHVLGPLQQLRDAIDESVLLSKVDGLQAMYLLVLQPSHPLRYLATVGERHAPGAVSAAQSEPGVTTLSCRFGWSSATYIVTVAGPTLRLQTRLSKTRQLLLQLCRQLDDQGRFDDE